MRDYLITPTEMRDLLERYAEGGAATMTKVRVNPAIVIIAIINLRYNFRRNESNS